MVDVDNYISLKKENKELIAEREKLRREVTELEMELYEYHKLYEEVKKLVDSGYDGEFMGDIVAPIFSIVIKLEAKNIKSK